LASWKTAIIDRVSRYLYEKPLTENMINWWNLFSNSIWILAIALVLAVFSIAYCQAQREEEKISTVLNSPKHTLMFNISGAVFCLGMVVTSNQWGEIGLWIFLTVMFVIQVWIVKVKKE